MTMSSAWGQHLEPSETQQHRHQDIGTSICAQISLLGNPGAVAWVTWAPAPHPTCQQWSSLERAHAWEHPETPLCQVGVGVCLVHVRTLGSISLLGVMADLSREERFLLAESWRDSNSGQSLIGISQGTLAASLSSSVALPAPVG